MLVGYGLDAQLHQPVEVHCYYTTGFLITMRRAPSPALAALTGHIETGWPAFLVLGVGLSGVCVTATVSLLRRRNWN